MLSKRWQGLLMMSLAVTLTLAYASPAFAQRDTGVMVVRAIDPDGAPLPGVQVVASGPVGTQTQYTGIDGTARFPGLYPGAGYTATFTLDGFKTVIREGLEITAQRTTAFDLTMELATVEETITVTGESPIVDVKSTDIAGLYSDDLIDMTPTASGIWAGVLDHVPGVMASLDVGGGDSGQQTTPRAWGSESWNNSYNVNGGDTTDPAATGASSSYFSVSSFEEVSVSLAAQDIEIKTPGVNMNMVVKSGSNDWHAGVKYFYEGESFVSNNVDAELEAEGITEGNPNKLLSDLDVQGGGPIVRNRAWFFVDYWDFEIQKLRIGIEEVDGTELKDWTFNINAQITDNHKVSGRYIKTVKYRNDRDATSSNPYIGRIQDSSTHIPQLQWQAVVNQNIFTDIRFSTVRSNFPLERRDNQSSNPFPNYVNVPISYDFYEGVYEPIQANPVSEFFDERDTDSLNGTASWYLTGERVSNDIKFGGNYMNINYFSPSNYPWGMRPYVRSNWTGNPAYDPNNNPNWAFGVPVEVRLYNNPTAGRDNGGIDCFVLNTAGCWYPDNAYNIRGKAYGLFFQDTITLGTKTTIIAGFRWDESYNWNPAQNRLDSPWCNLSPALQHPEYFCGGTFAEQDRPFKYSDITPRIGFVYDLLGDGRWAVKANYALYTEQLGTYGAGSTNVNGTGREDWNWTDANGDGRFQYGEQTTYRDRSFPGLGTGFDPGYQSPLVSEFTVGIDHELFDNILLSATGIFRGKFRADGNVNLGRPWGPMFDSDRCRAECTPVLPYGVDPWVEVGSVDPGNDGIIGTADDPGTYVPIWALNPDTYGTGDTIVTNSADFNLPSETDYKGFSLVLSKRWSDNWQLLASYDYGKSYYSGDYGATSPNEWYNDRKNQGFGSRPHMIKVTGNYLIAEPIGVNLGLFIRAQSGEPVRSQYSYSSEVIEPPFGPYDDQSNTTIYIDARGDGNEALGRPAREDFVTLVDVRAEKQVTIGKYGVLHFYFDVFNLFNANTVTEFRWWLGSRYMETYDILPPRVMRIGGAWDF